MLRLLLDRFLPYHFQFQLTAHSVLITKRVEKHTTKESVTRFAWATIPQGTIIIKQENTDNSKNCVRIKYGT
jgi:hypothetical protein